MLPDQLIDSTYFIDEITIPNIINTAVLSGLNQLIKRYQREILINALGVDLYYQLLNGYSAGGSDKWNDLIEGKIYTVNYDGKTYSVKWNGLVNSEKISLLAYFIFFHHARGAHNPFSASGFTKNSHENSSGISGERQLAYIWNKGVELYGFDTGNYLGDNAILRGRRYRDFIEKAIARGERFVSDITQPTLFNFIYFANDSVPDTYPNWVFTPFEKTNALGI